MKAIVRTTYGPPDILQLKEVEIPVPQDNEVLIKIYAVSLNASDWELLTGKPLYARLLGLLKPKYHILGSDIAGRVEAVGKNVNQFQPGDEVFGDIFECFGGFAEYVCVPESKLTPKPASLTFEQAAALPQAACLALQGIRDRGRIQQGHKVLINGAGGGSGTFAVQLAKLFGAEVTGVDNTEKLDTMLSIGADHVIDYTKEDFTKSGQRYDLILDLAAHHSIFAYKRALNPKGIYLLVGGSMSSVFQLLFMGPLISMFSRKKMGFLALKSNNDMDSIVTFVESGKVVPIIDRRFPLSEVPEALRYLGEGHAKGKVVINTNNGTNNDT